MKQDENVLNFQQIKILSLHDTCVASWKLDLEARTLEMILSMAYACSKEYGGQGTLSIKSFNTVDVVRWPDDKAGIPVEDPKQFPLPEILNEEFSETSYEISAFGQHDWLTWKFTWATAPNAAYERRRFQELDAVHVYLNPGDARSFVGTDSAKRPPRNGDRGTIVCQTASDTFEVECVNKEGLTLWLAQFSSEETVLRTIGPRS
jgi:hypothetical protein